MVLVDTSAWIDYFRGVDARHTRRLDECLGADRVATGDLIIAELMQGFRTKHELTAAREIIARLEYFDMAGKEVAYKAAENYRFLRAKGITVRKTMDMLIGTFCIERGIALLHNDRDFDPMERHLGLRVV